MANLSIHRVEVLEIWKEKWRNEKELVASYRNLLTCVAGKDHDVAKAICGLKIFHEKGIYYVQSPRKFMVCYQ